MPIQDLEKLFNMKVNKYEVQGMPLAQASEKAKAEMTNDPRVMNLIKQQQAQPATQTEPKQNTQQGGIMSSSPAVNAALGLLTVGNVINAIAGENTSEETQTETSVDTQQREPLYNQNIPSNVKTYSVAETLKPILDARMGYKQLQMANESKPYELPLKGYAPPTYFGIELNRRITDYLKNKPVKKEEQEAVDKLMQSTKESVTFFSPKEMTIDGSTPKKAGRRNYDLYVKAKADLKKLYGTDKDVTGSTSSRLDTAKTAEEYAGWALNALNASDYGESFDGTAQQLLDEGIYTLNYKNEWARDNPELYAANYANSVRRLKEVQKDILKSMVYVHKDGTEWTDEEYTKYASDYVDKKNEELQQTPPITQQQAMALANRYKTAKGKSQKDIANIINSLPDVSKKLVLVSLGYSFEEWEAKIAELNQ